MIKKEEEVWTKEKILRNARIVNDQRNYANARHKAIMALLKKKHKDQTFII